MSKKEMKRPQLKNVEPSKKLYHKTEKPVSTVYREIDNDLARDNLENDIPEADLQDL